MTSILKTVNLRSVNKVLLTVQQIVNLRSVNKVLLTVQQIVNLRSVNKVLLTIQQAERCLPKTKRKYTLNFILLIILNRCAKFK